MKTPFHLVVAYDKNRGIGYQNRLPWRLAKDMAWFKKLTVEQFRRDNLLNAVVMGSRTWESIPSKFRPLSKRINIVLSRQLKRGDIEANEELEQSNKDTHGEGVVWFDQLDQALRFSQKKAANTFVIGGSMIFSQALRHPDLVSIFATEIEAEYEVDCHFPDFSYIFQERKVIFSDYEKVRNKKVTFTMVQYTK